jgi:hypothetical protein
MKSSVVSGSYSIANVTADHTIAAIFTLSTSTSNTTSKAKVFLGVGDDIVTVSNSGMTVYGNTGIDTVTIADGVVGVTLDQSVERINLPSVANSYAFKQTGNKINVYDAAGVTLLVTVPVQGDSDGTLLLFSNGTTSALLSGGLMTLGGVTVSSTAAGVIVPTLTSAP